MYVLHMLNSGDEWEVSVKRFRFRHTALTYAIVNKLFDIYEQVEIVQIK